MLHKHSSKRRPRARRRRALPRFKFPVSRKFPRNHRRPAARPRGGGVPSPSPDRAGLSESQGIGPESVTVSAGARSASTKVPALNGAHACGHSSTRRSDVRFAPGQPAGPLLVTSMKVTVTPGAGHAAIILDHGQCMGGIVHANTQERAHEHCQPALHSAHAAPSTAATWVQYSRY